MSKRQVFCALFGIVLPILCFAFDPGVMYGRFSFGLAGVAPLFVYGVCALAVAAMCLFLRRGERRQDLDALAGGALLVGAFVALIIGGPLVPLALVGTIVSILILAIDPSGAGTMFAMGVLGL